MPLSLALALLTIQAAPIELRDGLAISGVTRAGRAPTFTDALLADWQKPELGKKVKLPNGEEREWTKLAAQEDGTIPGRSIGGGYAYFQVDSPKEEVRILEATGWGMAYVNGKPRTGDPYGFGYVKLPVLLKKGANDFLMAAGRGNPRARLVPPPAAAFFNMADATVPDFWGRGTPQPALAGIVVVNATNEWRRDLRILAKVDLNVPVGETSVPPLAPLSARKVPVSYPIPTTYPMGNETERTLILTLAGSEGLLDFQKLNFRVRTPQQTRKITFFSDIDGSVQYYALNPAQKPDAKALVLTLHGASVEAIGQADAYKGKDWCHIVAPTNRRPYGFDWEEIGRLDALEVLNHARGILNTDPLQTYLTGHSMGGHGAWTVGFHFPDLWAAVAPCAAWISFFSYGGAPRTEPNTPVEEMMYRSANASDTLLMLVNAMHYPIYVHHGDNDETVPIREARAMKETLQKAGHPNVTVHEHPGGGHWFGESVDFAPIFDLFQKTNLKSSKEKDEVEFASANLAATSKAWWVQILQQEKPMAASRVKFRRQPGGLVGTTENVEVIRFESEAFGATNPRVIEIDGQTLSIPNLVSPPTPVTLHKIRNSWTAAAGSLDGHKTPMQTGPFKNVFRNRFFFVYGTSGSREETAANLAKVRYDAEVFGYRGNGSVRILSDTEYLEELDEEAGRVYIRKPDVPNVILFGNADTNRAWSRLLAGSPIAVKRGQVKVGDRVHKRDDLAVLFVRPRSGDDRALVGVVASTGVRGQRVLERLPYFTSGVHYPDWIVISSEMLAKGVGGIRAAGFFRNDWGLSAKDTAEN